MSLVNKVILLEFWAGMQNVYELFGINIQYL